MTQLVLGTNTAGAARSYFSSTAYFNRHSRKGGADPFLQISPSSVHNSGSLYFYMQDEGWHSLAGIVGLQLRSVCLLQLRATSIK